MLQEAKKGYSKLLCHLLETPLYGSFSWRNCTCYSFFEEIIHFVHYYMSTKFMVSFPIVIIIILITQILEVFSFICKKEYPILPTYTKANNSIDWDDEYDHDPEFQVIDLCWVSTFVYIEKTGYSSPFYADMIYLYLFNLLFHWPFCRKFTINILI